MNEIFIHTNKGEYVGGETIYGTIYLRLGTFLPAKSLELRVKGLERTWWQYVVHENNPDGTTRREVRETSGKRDFFRERIVLWEFPSVFPMGYFAYPFQFTLPPKLPGVFRKEKKKREGERWKAEIIYKVKAILDIPGTKHDLKTTQPLVIHERLDQIPQMQHYLKQGTVRLLCCIPRGDVHCEAWMDKNAYMAGETAQIYVKVRNESASNINNFGMKLMRVITIKDSRNQTKRFVSTIAYEKYPGCLAGESKESSTPLPLTSRKGAHKYLQPSTSSNLVKTEYRVDIEMQIPWAPDVEIHIPVTMYSPANIVWSQWQPPTWAGQASIQQVSGPAAVPQSAYGTYFQNMPGFGYPPAQ